MVREARALTEGEIKAMEFELFYALNVLSLVAVVLIVVVHVYRKPEEGVHMPRTKLN